MPKRTKKPAAKRKRETMLRVRLSADELSMLQALDVFKDGMSAVVRKLIRDASAKRS